MRSLTCSLICLKIAKLRHAHRKRLLQTQTNIKAKSGTEIDTLIEKQAERNGMRYRFSVKVGGRSIIFDFGVERFELNCQTRHIRRSQYRTSDPYIKAIIKGDWKLLRINEYKINFTPEAFYIKSLLDVDKRR